MVLLLPLEDLIGQKRAGIQGNQGDGIFRTPVMGGQHQDQQDRRDGEQEDQASEELVEHQAKGERRDGHR